MRADESEDFVTSSFESLLSTTTANKDLNDGNATTCVHNGWIVLLVEFFERITYYSLIANLLLFCHSYLHVNAVNSTCIVLTFIGTSYIVPVFGVWITDSISGKFNLLYGTCLLYLSGTAILLTIPSQLDIKNPEKLICFFTALLLMAIGSGGIKSNISSFGTDQVAIYGTQAVKHFFTWFYYLINIASFLSYTLVAYLQTQTFFYGYVVGTSAMFLALLLLLSSRSKFVCKPANVSHLTDFAKLLIHSLKRRKFKSKIMQELPQTGVLDFLDYAHVLYGGSYTTSQIDLLRCLSRVLLVMSTTIVFWAAYFQMSSSFLIQGQHLNLCLPWLTKLKLPAASMNIFDCIFVLIFVRVTDPLFRVIGLRIRITPLRRMGVGIILAAASMLCAGFVEMHRKIQFSEHNDITNTIHNRTYHASNLTIFVQVPQYALIGASEAFTSISCLELAYSQTPAFLQNTVLAFFLLMSGFGALLACVYTKVVAEVSNWYCYDLNACYLEYYFYSIAALLLLNFFAFLFVAHRFIYVSDNYLVATTDPPTSPRTAISPALSQGHM